MSPGGTPQWWYEQAEQARRLAKEAPESSQAAAFLAWTVGRCRLHGCDPGWPFSTRRALRATDAFLAMLAELRDRVADVDWVCQLMAADVSYNLAIQLFSRRVDILGVQLILDSAFDAATPQYQPLVDTAADTIIAALLRLDSDLYSAMPLLRQHGRAEEIIDYYRNAILPEFCEQWWLDRPTTN